nr:IncQ plasmid conjugative transfer DNA nicking endonuclease TraR [Escherichia coli]
MKKGDLVKLKKLGQKEVKIPALDKNGIQQGWKTAHRNDWQLQNLGVKGIDRKLSNDKSFKLDDISSIQKQQQQMKKFNLVKQNMLQSQQKIKVGIKF